MSAPAPPNVAGDFIDIHQQAVLTGDASVTGAAFDRYIDALGTRSLRLKAPVWLPNLGATIELADDVVVTLAKTYREGATSGAAVTWLGSGEERFPRLQGTLWIASTGSASSILRFDARYRQLPRTLRLTAAAEAVIGHRIVLATARRLLRDVASAIIPEGIAMPLVG